MRDVSDFDKITIHLASPERIREWSYGEVKKPETINYRTLRPERDGLFCEKIFGTTKEWECYCGKFKSIRYKGVVCDRCGVEVAHFKIRRERMGHIELASPVSHIWYYKSVPSRIGLLLGVSVNELRSILYFEKYVVIDSGDTDLKEKQLLTESEYLDYKKQYGVNFTADIGAVAIKHLLENTDLDEEEIKLREKMNEKGEKTDPRLLKRLEIIKDFKNSKNMPDWMIMDVIPVIPPELRPMVQLDGGRFATSDLNDLYRRVINRNNRLKRLLNLKAPEIIIRNEKRMLQEAADALFDNSRRKRMVKGPGNRPLKSLSDMLKGKQGRFRQNLLGKRVDYSGRSVIVVGPDLKLHQCGLPKKMALELFKPFIMKGLVEKGLVYNIKSAKKMVEKEKPEVWGVLEEVIKGHPVLLNRAPTLHRLGIQAFEPVLIEGKAIRLHPLVCHAFNADFDGDQMAVHVPLSPEAQIECWVLMLSSNNLLNPANGEPIVGPTQDMVLGVNYLTKERRGAKGEGKHFSSFDEVMLALEHNEIEYQANIKVRRNNEWYISTPGRLIFNQALPDGMDQINETLNDKSLGQIILTCLRKLGPSVTVNTLDKIKDLGFKYATLFGATIGIDDIKIPADKKKLIDSGETKIKKIEESYRNGYITEDERYNKVIDVWTHVSDKISEVMMEDLKVDQNGFNSLYIMADSGARGSKQQIRQLAGMRGLMAKPSGEIIELPIKANFKEGLTVLEYFISTHGARKGLADTALKTADAGYLTRRLVDIAQDVVVNEIDCNTINGIDRKAIREGDEEIEKLSDRIVGRYVLENVYHPKTKQLIVSTNEEVTEEAAEAIEKAGIEKIRIRTVLTCESRFGICVKCYGRNLASSRTVEIGEAVGIIAAQSIGQPGTQLTMRTFHIGGTAARQIEEQNIELQYSAIIQELPESLIDLGESSITTRKGEMVLHKVIMDYPISNFEKIKVKDGESILIGDVIGISTLGEEVKSQNASSVRFIENNILLMGGETKIILKSGTKVNVKINDYVKKGSIVAEFDPYNEPILCETAGKVKYSDIIKGSTLKIEKIEESGVQERIVTEVRDGSLSPKVLIVDESGNEISSIAIPGGAHLIVDEGAKIKPGDVIAKITREQTKTKDITGGLPRIAELFEARKPKDSCVVSEQDGIVKFGDRLKGKTIINIEYTTFNEDGDEIVDQLKHVIPTGKRVLVRENDYVRAGEQLCDGPVNPHDILKIEGEQKLQEYLVNEIQEVYRLQGVSINDKHVGIIIRQMLKKVEITDAGDTDFIIGQQVDKFAFRDKNEMVVLEGG
ncbi:MAG: DNA-directed RNA polymerase subunit beta', partial [Spirochaetota bacterium]|nr:DNA-directed RNA polymerase subunit beta' [Spirochaetota bacterium]